MEQWNVLKRGSVVPQAKAATENAEERKPRLNRLRTLFTAATAISFARMNRRRRSTTRRRATFGKNLLLVRQRA